MSQDDKDVTQELDKHGHVQALGNQCMAGAKDWEEGAVDLLLGV